MPLPSTSARSTWPSTALPTPLRPRSSSATTSLTATLARSPAPCWRSASGLLLTPEVSLSLPVFGLNLNCSPSAVVRLRRDFYEPFPFTDDLLTNVYSYCLHQLHPYYYQPSFCTRYLTSCMSRLQSYQEIRVLKK